MTWSLMSNSSLSKTFTLGSLEEKNCWSENLVGPKEILGPKKILGFVWSEQSWLVQRKFWVNSILSFIHLQDTY